MVFKKNNPGCPCCESGPLCCEGSIWVCICGDLQTLSVSGGSHTWDVSSCCDCDPIIVEDCDVTCLSGLDGGDVLTIVTDPNSEEIDSSTVWDKSAFCDGDLLTGTFTFTRTTNNDPATVSWNSTTGNASVTDNAVWELVSGPTNWNTTGTLAFNDSVTFVATWRYVASGLVGADVDASCCIDPPAIAVTVAGEIADFGENGTRPCGEVYDAIEGYPPASLAVTLSCTTVDDVSTIAVSWTWTCGLRIVSGSEDLSELCDTDNEVDVTGVFNIDQCTTLSELFANYEITCS